MGDAITPRVADNPLNRMTAAELIAAMHLECSAESALHEVETTSGWCIHLGFAVRDAAVVLPWQELHQALLDAVACRLDALAIGEERARADQVVDAMRAHLGGRASADDLEAVMLAEIGDTLDEWSLLALDAIGTSWLGKTEPELAGRYLVRELSERLGPGALEEFVRDVEQRLREAASVGPQLVLADVVCHPGHDLACEACGESFVHALDDDRCPKCGESSRVVPVLYLRDVHAELGFDQLVGGDAPGGSAA